MISRKEVGNNMPEVYGISKSAKHIFERGYGQSAFNRTTAEDFFIDLTFVFLVFLCFFLCFSRK